MTGNKAINRGLFKNFAKKSQKISQNPLKQTYYQKYCVMTEILGKVMDFPTQSHDYDYDYLDYD